MCRLRYVQRDGRVVGEGCAEGWEGGWGEWVDEQDRARNSLAWITESRLKSCPPTNSAILFCSTIFIDLSPIISIFSSFLLHEHISCQPDLRIFLTSICIAWKEKYAPFIDDKMRRQFERSAVKSVTWRYLSLSRYFILELERRRWWWRRGIYCAALIFLTPAAAPQHCPGQGAAASRGPERAQ